MKTKTATLLPAGLDDDITDVYSTEFIADSEEITAAEKLANAAIDELNDTAERGKSIKIYRQTGDGQSSREFITSHPADKYTIDELILMIQRDYGGGNYRFVVYNEKGKISANKLICIALKLENKAGENSNGMAGVFSQYMNKQDRLLESLLNNNNNSGDDRASFMREMIMMKQLFGNDNAATVAPQQSQMDGLKEMLAVMALLKEQVEPPQLENDGGSFADIMSQSMPLLTELIKAGRGEPASNPRRTPNEKPPQNDTQKTEGKTMLNQIAKELLKYVQQNASPKSVSENLCNQVPDTFDEKFIEFLTDKKLLINICEKEPQLAQHEKWLIDVLEWAKWIMNQPSKFDTQDKLTPETDSNNIGDYQSDIVKDVKSSNDGNSER